MNINHIALNVHNLEATKDFFCKYFGGTANSGYHNPRTGLHSYFIDFPDGGARLELMHWEDMPNDTPNKPIAQTSAANLDHSTGYTHLSISVGSKEAVDELTARLAADGYKHISGPRTTGEGYYESCILLAEGEELELTI